MSPKDDPATLVALIAVEPVTGAGHADGTAGGPAALPTEALPPSSPGPQPRPGAAPRLTARPAPWRYVAGRKWLQLDGDLDRLADRGDPRAVARLRQLLAEAAAIIDEHGRLRRWWTGSTVERAWATLREVEEGLIFLEPDDRLDAVADDVSAHASFYLGKKDAALQSYEESRKGNGVPSREQSVALLRLSHAASDHLQQSVRKLRNACLTFSVTIALSLGMLCVFQSQTESFTFIDIPTDGNGSTMAPWVLLFLVMVFGMLGAVATVVGTLSKPPPTRSPFNLPAQQVLLKVVAGALTATLGTMFLTSDLVGADGLTSASLQSLLGAAVALGASQLAVTRRFDRWASDVLTPAADKPEAGTAAGAS